MRLDPIRNNGRGKVVTPQERALFIRLIEKLQKNRIKLLSNVNIKVQALDLSRWSFDVFTITIMDIEAGIKFIIHIPLKEDTHIGEVVFENNFVKQSFQQGLSFIDRHIDNLLGEKKRNNQ